MLVSSCCCCAGAVLQYIERMKMDILENLRHLAAAPGVGFHEVSFYSNMGAPHMLQHTPMQHIQRTVSLQ